jgi:hypothetical protein
VQFRDGAFVFGGEIDNVILHRRLPDGAKIGGGSFCEDSRGRWSINVPLEVPQATQHSGPGLVSTLEPRRRRGLSCGHKIATPAFYQPVK